MASRPMPLLIIWSVWKVCFGKQLLFSKSSRRPRAALGVMVQPHHISRHAPADGGAGQRDATVGEGCGEVFPAVVGVQWPEENSFPRAWGCMLLRRTCSRDLEEGDARELGSACAAMLPPPCTYWTDACELGLPCCRPPCTYRTVLTTAST